MTLHYWRMSIDFHVHYCHFRYCCGSHARHPSRYWFLLLLSLPIFSKSPLMELFRLCFATAPPSFRLLLLPPQSESITLWLILPIPLSLSFLFPPASALEVQCFMMFNFIILQSDARLVNRRLFVFAGDQYDVFIKSKMFLTHSRNE